MKTWLCLILAMLASTMGCAPGYYESPPASEASVSEAPATPGWYRNPETEEEYHRRIWWRKLRNRGAISIQEVPMILSSKRKGDDAPL